MLKIDGYDDAIIGKCSCWVEDQRVDRLVYDGGTVVFMLTVEGMEPDEAMEYIEYNIEGAYMGPGTPIIVWEYSDD